MPTQHHRINELMRQPRLESRRRLGGILREITKRCRYVLLPYHNVAFCLNAEGITYSNYTRPSTLFERFTNSYQEVYSQPSSYAR